MTRRGRLLEGLRVLDFSRVLAGPFCSALLADVGAEVVKIEPPGGDDYRHIGPFKNGESALFMLINRGKKSVVVDLKSPDSTHLVHELAACSDVVVENYRPGVTARLGIDYPSLSKINPKLVYASVSGFGQSGPMAERPSYDIIAQALSGMMSITGDAAGPPMRTGEPMGDLCAGLFAAWGIMVALYARDRNGHGSHVDVAMFDTLLALLPTSLAQLLYAGDKPVRTGNRHPLSSPFGSFETGDGHVVIAVANNALFARLAIAMEMPELVDDARFLDDEARTRHEPVLRALIENWARDKKVAEVVTILDQHAVPAAPIWDVEQAVSSAQTAFRQLLHSCDHPVAGAISMMEQPVHYSGVERGVIERSPLLGEHTNTVLSEWLDADEARIAALRRTEVIA
jgi:CoA:oxalate CoA-transferase